MDSQVGGAQLGGPHPSAEDPSRQRLDRARPDICRRHCHHPFSSSPDTTWGVSSGLALSGSPADGFFWLVAAQPTLADRVAQVPGEGIVLRGAPATGRPWLSACPQAYQRGAVVAAQTRAGLLPPNLLP